MVMTITRYDRFARNVHDFRLGESVFPAVAPVEVDPVGW